MRLVPHRRSTVVVRPLPPILERFGIRSWRQLRSDLGEVVRDGLGGTRFQFGLTSIGHLRPDLSLPAYAGRVPEDGKAPIMNLFDRVGGGKHYSQRVTKNTGHDFRGRRLTYDEHDGTDIVCPVATPLCSAAPGTVVMVRDRWLRGGLTIAVDHGHGVITQYTHCSRQIAAVGARVERGQPVALSGSSGFDMFQFFPWVPPHVHFMAWVDGKPVDPFVTEGESDRAGMWLDKNDPTPSGRRDDDPQNPPTSDWHKDALANVADACTDPRVQKEIANARHEPTQLAALLEDALHHDRFAFDPVVHDVSLRPAATPARKAAAQAIRLSLPLPTTQYSGTFFAD